MSLYKRSSWVLRPRSALEVGTHGFQSRAYSVVPAQPQAKKPAQIGQAKARQYDGQGLGRPFGPALDPLGQKGQPRLLLRKQALSDVPDWTLPSAQV